MQGDPWSTVTKTNRGFKLGGIELKFNTKGVNDLHDNHTQLKILKKNGPHLQQVLAKGNEEEKIEVLDMLQKFYPDSSRVFREVGGLDSFVKNLDLPVLSHQYTKKVVKLGDAANSIFGEKNIFRMIVSLLHQSKSSSEVQCVIDLISLFNLDTSINNFIGLAVIPTLISLLDKEEIEREIVLKGLCNYRENSDGVSLPHSFSWKKTLAEKNCEEIAMKFLLDSSLSPSGQAYALNLLSQARSYEINKKFLPFSPDLVEIVTKFLDTDDEDILRQCLNVICGMKELDKDIVKRAASQCMGSLSGGIVEHVYSLLVTFPFLQEQFGEDDLVEQFTILWRSNQGTVLDLTLQKLVQNNPTNQMRAFNAGIIKCCISAVQNYKHNVTGVLTEMLTNPICHKQFFELGGLIHLCSSMERTTAENIQNIMYALACVASDPQNIPSLVSSSLLMVQLRNFLTTYATEDLLIAYMATIICYIIQANPSKYLYYFGDSTQMNRALVSLLKAPRGFKFSKRPALVTLAKMAENVDLAYKYLDEEASNHAAQVFKRGKEDEKEPASRLILLLSTSIADRCKSSKIEAVASLSPILHTMTEREQKLFVTFFGNYLIPVVDKLPTDLLFKMLEDMCNQGQVLEVLNPICSMALSGVFNERQTLHLMGVVVRETLSSEYQKVTLVLSLLILVPEVGEAVSKFVKQMNLEELSQDSESASIDFLKYMIKYYNSGKHKTLGRVQLLTSKLSGCENILNDRLDIHRFSKTNAKFVVPFIKVFVFCSFTWMDALYVNLPCTLFQDLPHKSALGAFTAIVAEGDLDLIRLVISNIYSLMVANIQKSVELHTLMRLLVPYLKTDKIPEIISERIRTIQIGHRYFPELVPANVDPDIEVIPETKVEVKKKKKSKNKKVENTTGNNNNNKQQPPEITPTPTKQTSEIETQTLKLQVSDSETQTLKVEVSDSETQTTANPNVIDFSTLTSLSLSEIENLEDTLQHHMNSVRLIKRDLQYKDWKQKEKERMICPICLENEKNATFDPCGHVLCVKCANQIMKIGSKKCPICRAVAKRYTEFFL